MLVHHDQQDVGATLRAANGGGQGESAGSFEEVASMGLRSHWVLYGIQAAWLVAGIENLHGRNSGSTSPSCLPWTLVAPFN